MKGTKNAAGPGLSRTDGSEGLTAPSDRLVDVLIRYRWLFVVPIVLPLSVVFNAFWALCNRYHGFFQSAPGGHDKRVRDLQQQLAVWRRSDSRAPLCTARKPWMSISTRVARYKHRHNTIAVSLYDILDIDTRRRVVRVEPLVTIGQLTRRLVPLGWTLPIVPELDDLTVSGLLLGYGIESSSHKYGLFADIIEACEVLIGDGTVVRAARDNHSDLFHALPWSYGALGILVSIELRIIPCKPWVHLTYRPVVGREAICRLLEQDLNRVTPPEFIEGIVFDSDRAVVITGDMADEPHTAKRNAIGRWFKPWFYKHCESMLERGVQSECMPLRHYYHRHTRSLFWEGELIIPFGNHPLFRYLLGWMMPPKIAFLKLTQGDRIRRYYEDRHVVQEILVPLVNLRDTLEFLHRRFECYPVWLCPHRLYRTDPQGFLSPAPEIRECEMYVDAGVWSIPGAVRRGEPFHARPAVRELEAFAIRHRAYQCLYAVTELSRAEYRQMFDCTLYDKVRKKYYAEGVFMDTYDKVKRSG